MLLWLFWTRNVPDCWTYWCKASFKVVTKFCCYLVAIFFTWESWCYCIESNIYQSAQLLYKQVFCRVCIYSKNALIMNSFLLTWSAIVFYSVCSLIAVLAVEFCREEWITAIQSVSQKLQILEGTEIKDDFAEKQKKKVVSKIFVLI